MCVGPGQKPERWFSHDAAHFIFHTAVKLLAGAKLLVNNGDYRVFSRPGGYAQARADFETLGLSNIKQTEVGYTHIVSIKIDENRY